MALRPKYKKIRFNKIEFTDRSGLIYVNKGKKTWDEWFKAIYKKNKKAILKMNRSDFSEQDNFYYVFKSDALDLIDRMKERGESLNPHSIFKRMFHSTIYVSKEQVDFENTMQALANDKEDFKDLKKELRLLVGWKTKWSSFHNYINDLGYNKNGQHIFLIFNNIDREKRALLIVSYSPKGHLSTSREIIRGPQVETYLRDWDTDPEEL